MSMPVATLDLAAPIAGGLTVLVLVAWVVPAIWARRAAASRLQAFVATPPAGPASPGRHSPATGLAARKLRVPLPRWLAGRLRLVCLLLGATAGACLLSRDPSLTTAAFLEALLFASLLGQNLVAARASQLDAQTLPTLLRLSAVLRTGGSLGQAMQAVAEEGPSPTRDEFARTLNEVAVGAALDDALERLAERIGTADYTLLARVLKVQRRLGGNLPQVLDNLAETIRERVMLRKELATLTAQQRLSTWIMVLLPVVILGVFALVDRSFVAPLFGTDVGHVLVIVAVALQLVGGWALRWAGRIAV
jgi:Flp pilus assembly protein TadB